MKPNEGAEDAAGAPAAAPAFPKRPPGLGVSPLGLPNPPNPPNPGVVDAPGVAPAAPKRPPGLLAGVLDAPPPNTLDELVAVVPLPNRPLLGALEVALLAVPKRDGAPAPDELAGAPNNDLFGVLLLFCWPKEKPDMLTVMSGWMWWCEWSVVYAVCR